MPNLPPLDPHPRARLSSGHHNACDGCGQTLDRRRRGHVELGPIVHDEIWRQLAKPTEALCWDCMLERTRVRLGRMLTLADLQPCCWNLYGQPYSYLDLFVDIEGRPPANLAEWRSVGDPGEFRPITGSVENKRGRRAEV